MNALLALVFPQRCLACGTAPIARFREHGVCDGCHRQVVGLAIQPPWCACCGVPTCAADGSGGMCIRCVVAPPPYAAVRAVGRYAGELRRLVHALKFEGRRQLRHVLGPLLAAACLQSWRPGEFDVIVPVPLHPERERRRGYNQAALLGRTLGALVGIATADGALRRVRNTRTQVGLSLRDRRRNLDAAFLAASTALAGSRVLLVDDVVTTGATAASAAAALLEGGALRVGVLAVARALDGPDGSTTAEVRVRGEDLTTGF